MALLDGRLLKDGHECQNEECKHNGCLNLSCIQDTLDDAVRLLQLCAQLNLHSLEPVECIEVCENKCVGVESEEYLSNSIVK